VSEQHQPDTSLPDLALPAQRPDPDQPPDQPPGETDPDELNPNGLNPNDAGTDRDAGTDGTGTDEPGPRRWSVPSLLVLCTAAAVLLAATAWHLGTVFLSIAPSNPASQRYTSQVNAHVYPEFEQNWQLFAPNPLQENIAVEARVQTLTPAGGRPDSGWINLTAQDIAHVRGDLAPSHVDQNLLRRAWDYYTSWHNLPSENSLGSGGPLSQEYLKRIALQRVGRDWHGDPVNQIQFRIATTPVTGPRWTGAQQKAKTSYQTLQWWVVGDEDYTGLLP
jgi:hypothetical protein